jgi:hypothetical protein
LDRRALATFGSSFGGIYGSGGRKEKSGKAEDLDLRYDVFKNKGVFLFFIFLYFLFYKYT